MNEDKLKLLELMETISERCYCAGWMNGLEYALWSAVEKGYMEYGVDRVSAAEAQELKRLSDIAGGWFTYVSGIGTVFVAIDEWLEMYEKEQKAYDRLMEELGKVCAYDDEHS